MSPSDFLLILSIALMALAVMLLIQKPRALTPKDEAAWLDFAIRTKRAELAEARKHHRPSADLQRELSVLVAKKLRAETEPRKASSAWRGAR